MIYVGFSNGVVPSKIAVNILLMEYIYIYLYMILINDYFL